MPIPKIEVVKMVARGLDCYIRKKLVNQHLVDLAQWGHTHKQIE